MGVLLSILTLLGLSLFFWWYFAKGTVTETWLPGELHRAQLQIVETTYKTEQPYRIAAKPDRAYRLPSGELVLMELKTRPGIRVFDTDIAELSLQAWVLRSLGERVKDHAYVAVLKHRSSRPKPERVSLLDDKACLKLIERCLELKTGAARPRSNASKHCLTCAYQTECFRR
jgi:CRISPR-associated exonuclease Cas4